MTTTKKSSKERIAKWRQSLKERGGMEIVVPLEKEAVDQLKQLQEYYGGISYGDVVTLALNMLSMTKSVFKPESVLKKRGKDVEGKE
jgi:hypothetical protein